MKYQKHYKIYDVTNIFNYLREAIQPWAAMTKRACNNKCVLTGVDYNIEVHHQKLTFKTIVNDAFKELNMKFSVNTSDFTQEELKLISDKVLEIHMQLGPGVCLNDKVHKKLHQVTGGGYGERYIEFVQKYKEHKRKSQKKF